MTLIVNFHANLKKVQILKQHTADGRLLLAKILTFLKPLHENEEVESFSIFIRGKSK